MAYFRGETHIWSDGDNLHLWSHNGMDSWDTTGWCLDEDEQRYPGYENASGVSIPEKIADQLTLMRFAEILVNDFPERVEQLIDEACEVGNFGSGCLQKNAQLLKDIFRALQLEKPDPR